MEERPNPGPWARSTMSCLEEMAELMSYPQDNLQRRWLYVLSS